MIVFTLVYSSVFDDALTRWLGVVLFIHMAVQSAFTIAAHAREMRSDGTIAVVVAAVLTLAAWAGFLLPANHAAGPWPASGRS